MSQECPNVKENSSARYFLLGKAFNKYKILLFTYLGYDVTIILKSKRNKQFLFSKCV
jgi:hypothetical protein